VVADAPVPERLSWPRHPSASLAREVRDAIRADDSAPSVQAALLRHRPRDTLPAVLFVTDRGGTRVARFYYRKLVWEASVPNR